MPQSVCIYLGVSASIGILASSEFRPVREEMARDFLRRNAMAREAQSIVLFQPYLVGGKRILGSLAFVCIERKTDNG